MRYLFISLIFLTLFSCTSQRDKSVTEIKMNLEQVNKNFAENNLDTTSARKAEENIGKFLEKYPKDTLASRYLFELGMLYQKQRRFEDAVTTFDKVYVEYPDSREASNAVFLQGFLYANVLNKLDRAKEKYELYLEKFSNADPKMTRDVQMELNNLGKSPDELLKEIQEKNDSSTRQG